MALARLKLFKSNTYLAIDPSWAGADDNNDVYSEILKIASTHVEKWCARRLIRQTYTDELYTGNDSNKLYLNEWPVVEIISVKLWDGSDSYDVETSTYYALIQQRDEDPGYIYYPALGQESNGSWSGWESDYANGIKITYTAGYSDTGWKTKDVTDAFGVPADLEHATCLIAYKIWKDSAEGGGRFGLASMAKGDASMGLIESVVRAFPAEVKMILHTYRRLSI